MGKRCAFIGLVGWENIFLNSVSLEGSNGGKKESLIMIPQGDPAAASGASPAAFPAAFPAALSRFAFLAHRLIL